jgi:hypothetical protein
MGYKDAETGKWVIQPAFDFCKDFGPDGTAVVFKNGLAGFIDRTGKIIIAPAYADAQNFNEEGIAIVRQAGRNDNRDGGDPSNDRFGAINKSGKLVLPFVFRELNDKSFKGTLIGKKERLWGMVNYKAATLLDFRYHMINVHSSREAAIVRKDSVVGVIDKNMSWIVPEGDNMARFAGNGLISVFSNGKFGYVNFKGELVIPYIYDQFSIFREGRCIIKKNGFYGFIDTLGNTVIPFEYDGGENFTNDTAIMLKQGKLGMINSQNEILVEFVYDKISRYYFPRPPGGFVLIKQDIWYYIDPVSREITMWNELDLKQYHFIEQPPDKKRK